jgi:hypothetical protein
LVHVFAPKENAMMRLFFATLAVTALPGLAIAQGCHGDRVKEVTAMSCVEGTVWSAELGNCVAQPSS